MRLSRDRFRPRSPKLWTEALQHADAVTALHRFATDIQESLKGIGLSPPELHGSVTCPLLEFFAHTLGKLRLFPGFLEDKVREAAEQAASSVGSVILPWVALLVPGFPFDRLLHEYEEGDDEEGAKMAVQPSRA